jgi:transposase
VPGDGDGDGDASPSKDAAADDVASPSAGLPQRDEPVEDAGESFDQDTDPQTVLTSRQRERRLQGRRLKERRPPRREDAAALGRGTSFSPEQRLLLLDTWLRSGLPAKDFAALVGVSKHTLYKWKQLFDQQGPAGLMDKPRGATRGSRLPEVTKRTILMLKQQHPEWGCQRISDLLVRGPALPASASAVARVLHEAGYERVEEATRPHQPKRCRFERAKPNELWQTDLFTFMLKRHNRRVYLVAFLDDHSRFLVSYGLHASASTALVLEALEARIAGWGPPAEILTDNGPQYVGGTGGVLRDRRAIHQEQRVAAATVSQRRALGLARRTGLQCTARAGSVPARRSASGKRTGCGR